MLPTFLIVGAEKAGTTTLAAALAAHPDVYMAPVKEVRFFYSHWDKGIEWYKQFFADAKQAVRGEASPAYTWHPRSADVPARIHSTLGDIKYIYIVRHPLDRAMSHYRHALYHNWIPATSTFEQALETNRYLRDCSRYYYQLEQYLPYTGRSQWSIVALEELRRDAPAFYTEVFQFLEVNLSFRPPLSARNVTDEKKIKPPWLVQLSRRLRPIRDVLPTTIHRKLRLAAHDWFSQKVTKPELSPALRARLVEEFIPDVERLSRFSEKDFIRLWGLG